MGYWMGGYWMEGYWMEGYWMGGYWIKGEYYRNYVYSPINPDLGPLTDTGAYRAANFSKNFGVRFFRA